MNKQQIKAIFCKGVVITEDTDLARDFHNKSCYGMIENNKLHLSLIEALFLMEKDKLKIYDKRNHLLSFEEYVKKAVRLEPNFWTRYRVFKDLRSRGYIVKTALKFGADFRVYDRGIKPGEDHARWVVYPVQEGNTLTWYEFAAKNRVAHSTKKRLLLAVVDDEGDVSYWECRWIRP